MSRLSFILSLHENVKLLLRPEQQSTLSLFTPRDLRLAEMNGELDLDANILDLRPSPPQFTKWLKSLDRADIASAIFVKLLESYRDMKGSANGDVIQKADFICVSATMLMSLD